MITCGSALIVVILIQSFHSVVFSANCCCCAGLASTSIVPGAATPSASSLRHFTPFRHTPPITRMGRPFGASSLSPTPALYMPLSPPFGTSLRAMFPLPCVFFCRCCYYFRVFPLELLPSCRAVRMLSGRL